MNPPAMNSTRVATKTVRTVTSPVDKIMGPIDGRTSEAASPGG